MLWFDGHLDLGMLAVAGRDMLAPLDPGMAPHPPAAVTLPSLAQGNVRLALGTIFTEAGGSGPDGYPAGDAEAAYKRGRAQLEAYRTWQDAGALSIDFPRVLKPQPGTGEVRGGMGVAETVTTPVATRLARMPRQPKLHVGILIENADPIRTPDELAWWKDAGVCTVGMAWWASSRYAGGNGADPANDPGVTDLGRALVRTMDELNIVHDQSHLSDGATRDLFELTDRPIIASHSNCRSLVGTGDAKQDQRHLSDDTIKEIVRRGGMIGLNLAGDFIAADLAKGQHPTIEQTVAHVEHICSLVGNTDHVGLGSDLDGGFSADELPAGINHPRDYYKLLDALQSKGWDDDQLAAFAHRNWVRFFTETVVKAPSPIC